MCVAGKPCATGWAEPLPADDCPPASRLDPEGETLYRFIEKDTPEADDFLSHEALGKFMRPDTPPCVKRAVSLFASLEFCRKSHPLATKKKKKLARISITRGQGVLSPPAPNSHVSWWRCGGHDPVPVASVVNETDDA
jgi:hypothetical protein